MDSNTRKACWLLSPHTLAAAAVTSGARKWSLVFVGIGVGAIVAALFQARAEGMVGLQHV